MPETDEDSFVMPDAWRAHLHPRHGGVPGPPVEPDPDAAEAVRAFTEEVRDPLRHLLDAEASDPELVESTRAHLDGTPDPRGAGVIAAVVAAESDMIGDVFAAIDRLGATWRFADAWIAEHGLAFAAAATAELGRVTVAHGHTRNGRKPWQHLRTHRLGVKEPHADKVRYCLQLVARRMRAFLAAAGDHDYREAVEALAHRRRDDAQRLIVSYLAPTRLDWSDELCAALPVELSIGDQMLLVPSIGSPEQLERLEALGHVDLSPRTWTPDPLYTVVEAVGPAMAPRVAAAYDEGGHFIAAQARVLAALPTDEAFRLLLARLHKPQVHAAVTEAARRYPARALRLLGEASASGGPEIAPYAARLLRRHVRAHPDLTATLLPGLPAEVRRAVESIDALAGERWAEEAPPEALPRVLCDPPWTREGARVKPVAVRGLKAPDEPEIAWEPGEREEWAAASRDGDDDAEIARMKPVIARDGLEALPAALELALSRPATATELLLPLCDARVAALMAESLDRRPLLRPVAERWFHRHAFAAAHALVPAALGKAGRQRREAEAALRFLASNGHRDGVVDAARALKPKAAAAVETLLDTDPLNVLPDTMPEHDPWVDPHLLPQVLLRDGRGALGGEAAGHIITMLALSKPDHAYPGIDVVKETCEPASLAAFAWGLFEQYGLAQRSDGPGDDAWVFTALGLLGDDGTVRRLTPLIRTWPGDGGHHLAVAGLDALVAIGTDIALTHLNGIARNVRYKGVKTKAQERITALAADLGLSPERLGDRLVPDLGLDGTGGLVLDYGPRRFTVGFDENLRPYVLDENGGRRAALPKPGARDDPALAPAARERFAALKKDVKTVAADQILRLEQAMVAQRRWTAAEFQTLIAGHPLLWHIARRLVWIADGVRAFRIAEDRTLADLDDAAFTLTEGARVGVAHPLHLAGTLDAWCQVFADYEIAQPFPQLDRPTAALTDDERSGTELKRFHGRTVPVGQVLGMERRGWWRGTAEDNGVRTWITREVADGRAVVVDLDPGIPTGDPRHWPEQTITGVRLNDGTELSRRIERAPLPFAALDPVTASEILTDLAHLTTGA